MTYAQSLDESGISAGFFDSSEESTLNFSTFHLPPLSVLFENAKQNPQILSLDKVEQLAKAEVAKQKRHIFSYVRAHASYSYGKTDVYGQMTNNQTGTMNFVPIFESKKRNRTVLLECRCQPEHSIRGHLRLGTFCKA